MEWKLFADLAEVAGDKRVAVDVEPGGTVGDAIEALVAARPALRERVFEAGELAGHITVLRNGQDVFSAEAGLETTLEPDDELAMFPPVSGG